MDQIKAYQGRMVPRVQKLMGHQKGFYVEQGASSISISLRYYDWEKEVCSPESLSDEQVKQICSFYLEHLKLEMQIDWDIASGISKELVGDGE